MNCENHPTVDLGLRPCWRCGRFFCEDCLVGIADRLYCGECKNERLLDTRSGVNPEHLPLSSFLRRYAARLIDSIVLSPIPIAINVGLAFLTTIHRIPSFAFVVLPGLAT